MQVHGCHPFGNAKARAVVWNFPDAIPQHREPLYGNRADLQAKYPTHDDKKAFWRLPTLYKTIQQKNIADKAVLGEVLSAAGFSPEEFFAAADNPANKEKLKATTDEAVERGVFGAPTFFVKTPDGEEMHFGQDRLDFVEDALKRA